MLTCGLSNRLHRCSTNTVGRLVPYKYSRWALTASLILLYLERSYGMSYYIVTYLIAFYVLQVAIGFWTPKGLEEIQEMDDCVQYRQVQDVEENEDASPLTSDVGEFQVWQRVTLAFTMGIICTCFKLLQIDVFWPLLVIYFLILLGYTIKKILTQMRKHSYSWNDFYKK